MKLLDFNTFIGEQKTRVQYTRPGGYFRKEKTTSLKLGSNTKIEQILKFIYDGGSEGRSWKEIHKFIVEELKGLKQNLSHSTAAHGSIGPSNRGYYSSIFTYYLPHFAEKGSDKRWRITNQEVLRYFIESDPSLTDEEKSIRSAAIAIGIYNDIF